MIDVKLLTDTQLTKITESGGYWDKEHARDELYRRTEEGNRKGKVIGDVIDFVRFGSPVSHSTNHRDSNREDGMSVYLLDHSDPVFVGFYFGIVDRPAYRGRGTIVSWGSDGEPIVEVIGDCIRSPEFDR